MTTVSLTGLSKVFSAAEGASVDDLTLELESGALTALLGPSGCGKTTTMKMIAGLLAPTAGDIAFDGRSVLKTAPERRGAVMVFQNALLFPHMSVAENVGFGLRMRGAPAAEIGRRVEEMLALVRLPGFAARRPDELSGGQAQRVALARALITAPQVLLLDEPLSALDAHLREEMRELIRDLQRRTRVTAVFVTHDQEEAATLADRIALMFDGRLRQYDRPEAFFRRPVDRQTAVFFGGRNFISGVARGGVFSSAVGQFRLPKDASDGAGMLTFRPEDARIAAAPAENAFAARATRKTPLGALTRARFAAQDVTVEVLANARDVDALSEGDEAFIHIAPDALWRLSD
ncbi:MAG: ABC transporter ATP-binding protein [Pseudomonadota bacterium]